MSPAQSHHECRGFPKTCVNSSPWLWPSKVHDFFHGAEILFIRCNRAADIHRNTQVSLWFLHRICKAKNCTIIIIVVPWYLFLTIKSHLYILYCLWFYLFFYWEQNWMSTWGFKRVHILNKASLLFKTHLESKMPNVKSKQWWIHSEWSHWASLGNL